MPLRLVKRGRWYHIHGAVHGVAIRKAAGTTDRRIAEDVRAALERDIHARVVLGKAPETSFSDAAAGYLEAGGDPRFVLAVIDAFQDRPVTGLRQPDLDAAALKAYPAAAPSTRHRQFYTPFIAIMNYAADQGWCTPRRWRRPAPAQGRLDWRTPEEMEAFILAAPWHLARNVMIYLGTMMRASEGVNLDWRDAASDGAEITLWETKGGYARRTPVLARARALVADAEAPGPVIRTDDGAPYHAYTALDRAIVRVCEARNLPRFSLHVLRHTGATWRYALDPDLPRLMSAGGWRSAQMALRYTHVSSRDLPARLEQHGWTL